MRKIERAATIILAATFLSGCGAKAPAGVKDASVSEQNRAGAFSTAVEEDEVQNAHWIWDDSNENDSWMRFRKTFTLSETPEEANAVIAADSKYFLWVNGEPVVREGGIKRGQSPESIYYDTVDLKDYLKEGENTIAALAWYFGSGFSSGYITSGEPAFFMSLSCGDADLSTDKSWLVSRDPSFLHDNQANYRLPEQDVSINAAMIEDWQNPSYDDGGWEPAVEKGMEGDLPWGTFVERPIPMFSFGEQAHYLNAGDFEGTTKTGDELWALDLPYNMQFLPSFRVEDEEGHQVIRVWTDMYEDHNGNSVMLKYLTKKGEQSFESPAWLSGEHVYFEIPPGVRVVSLTYRETGYGAEPAGSFHCDDAYFDELWKKAQRTLYVNLRDTYMDCPNRERAQWFADCALEFKLSACAMEPEAMQLYRSAVETTVKSPRGKELLNQLPTNAMADEITMPVQILMGFSELYEYYLFTGDEEFLEEVYEPVRDYLLGFKVGNKGVVKYRYGQAWEWADSTEWTDYALMQSAWYAYDMLEMAKIARLVSKEEEALFTKRFETIRDGMRMNYRHGDGLFYSGSVPKPDERVQALFILSGIMEEEDYGAAAALFQEERQCAPLLEYYVEKACYAIGQESIAMQREKELYYEMNAGEYAMSTLWEHWAYQEGTSNHAWAGGPLPLLSIETAGIHPETPGFETFTVEPKLGTLQELICTMPTIRGDITVEVKRAGAAYDITIICPTGTQPQVTAPEGTRFVTNNT